MADLHQVPPGLEVWKIAGRTYLVRRVTEFGMDPPLFMHWEVAPEDVAALGITKYDYSYPNQQALFKTGSLYMGSSRELLNTTEDPVDAIVSNYETEVKVKPWLADPEILNLWIGAAEEGRGLNAAELQGTEWWRTHTDTELQWLTMNAQDPATADQLIADNRIQVADMFQQAGVDNASPELINLVADNWTTGAWSQVYATNQVRLLADPNLTGTLDASLTSYRDSGLDTTRGREDTVTSLINTWLGAVGSQGWTQENIATWASRLRENPDAQIELVDVLKKQRQALYPEYTNENLTYEDIAAPWRGIWSQVLGQTPDETNPMFSRIVRLNDLSTAQRLLREEGLKTNNANVAKNVLSDIGNAFGGSVRPADSAIL